MNKNNMKFRKLLKSNNHFIHSYRRQLSLRDYLGIQTQTKHVLFMGTLELKVYWILILSGMTL